MEHISTSKKFVFVPELERDGFDLANPLFHTYVAESTEKPGCLVGYALYYWTYGTWTGRKLYLEDIYITESHRGTGAGYALMRKVVEVRGSCHKRQKLQAPTPQAPIRNRQTRKVANAKGLDRNTNLT